MVLPDAQRERGRLDIPPNRNDEWPAKEGLLSMTSMMLAMRHLPDWGELTSHMARHTG